MEVGDRGPGPYLRAPGQRRARGHHTGLSARFYDGHLVLVTSRRPLTELEADGAHLHALGPLPPTAARRYLAARAGEDRVRAEPQAAEQLVQLAAGLPAALALTAAQLSLHPQRSLSGLARALTPAPPDRPGAIMSNHVDAAYTGLDRATARTYRDLSRLPVHDVEATLVAAVRDTSPQEATEHLDNLAAKPACWKSRATMNRMACATGSVRRNSASGC